MAREHLTCQAPIVHVMFVVLSLWRSGHDHIDHQSTVLGCKGQTSHPLTVLQHIEGEHFLDNTDVQVYM